MSVDIYDVYARDHVCQYDFKITMKGGCDPRHAIEFILSQHTYTIRTIIIESVECSGCSTDQPNQLAHMDIGGCLCEIDNDIIDQTGFLYPMPTVHHTML